MKTFTGYSDINQTITKITGTVAPPVKEDTDFYFCLVTVEPILQRPKKIYGASEANAYEGVDAFLSELLMEFSYDSE